ncbi:MAG: hypothetical protein ACLP51_13285 [Syntrophobacteraceae bacterium]
MPDVRKSYDIPIRTRKKNADVTIGAISGRTTIPACNNSSAQCRLKLRGTLFQLMGIRTEDQIVARIENQDERL